MNPIPQLIFWNAVQNTSKPTKSKSPTSFEQGTQSDASSEDTSENETSEIETSKIETSSTKPRIHRQSLKFHENFRREKDNSPTVPTYGYFTKEKVKKTAQPPYR